MKFKLDWYLNGEESIESQVKKIEKERKELKKEQAKFKREAKVKLKAIQSEENADEIETPETQCSIFTNFMY